MGASGAAGRLHVVYLGGFGRSGSTLLERVLGAIPGWVNIGELVDLPRSVYVHQERCGCGEPFLACPFWGEVGALAHGLPTAGSGGWDPARMARLAELRTQVARQRQLPALLALSRGRGGSSLLAGQVREYQSEYGRIYRAVAEVGGARVVVDASKGPAHGLALGLRLPGGEDRGYDLSMVNLVRDPRGVAYSWSRRQVVRPQAGTANEHMWSISSSRSAAQWAALQTEMDLIGRAGGIRCARLRYEDLVDAPERAVQEVVARLGLAVGHADLAHLDGRTVTLAASHGLSGNPSRFTHGSTALRSDVAWREGLPTRERRVVTGVTMPWLLRYGYVGRHQPAVDEKESP